MLPSVTQIIGPWIDWANIPPDLLEVAADRGSRVHTLCAAYLQDLWISEVDEDCQGFFDSFRRWVDDTVIKVVFVEERMTHSVYKFTGQPDAGVIIKGDSSITVPDWKTPLALSKSWRLQNAAYHDLAVDKGYDVARVGSLRLHKQGRKAKFQEYTGTISHDFSVFLNALSVYQFIYGGK